MITIRLLTFFIVIIAFLITIDLVNAKDGLLRKILISYFAVEVLIWSVVLYFSIKIDFSIGVKQILTIILIPKGLVKGVFYYYLSSKRKHSNLTTNN